jgi:hypothetical protein
MRRLSGTVMCEAQLGAATPELHSSPVGKKRPKLRRKVVRCPLATIAEEQDERDEYSCHRSSLSCFPSPLQRADLAIDQSKFNARRPRSSSRNTESLSSLWSPSDTMRRSKYRESTHHLCEASSLVLTCTLSIAYQGALPVDRCS